MIVADTSAVLALLDRSARHHASLRQVFERHAEEWVLPWVIRPELDYMAARVLGSAVARALRGGWTPAPSPRWTCATSAP